ncbi:MAG: hypothetical protein H7270_10050 [Dermatophilaceae bacterium]|nr:hypothetical protein [Dermatophilaceae bacterium]
MKVSIYSPRSNRKAVAAEDLPDLILVCEAKLAFLELTMPTQNGEARDQTADQRDQSAGALIRPDSSPWR